MLITKNIYNQETLKDNYIYCTFKDLSNISNNFTASIEIKEIISFLKNTEKLRNNSIVNLLFYDDIIQINIDQWYYVIIYNTNKKSFNAAKFELTKFEYQNS